MTNGGQQCLWLLVVTCKVAHDPLPCYGLDNGSSISSLACAHSCMQSSSNLASFKQLQQVAFVK